MNEERDYTVHDDDISPYNGGQARVSAFGEKYFLQGDIETIEIFPDGKFHIHFTWAYRSEAMLEGVEEYEVPTEWCEVIDLDYSRTFVFLDGSRGDGSGILSLATHDGDHTPRHFLQLRPKGYHDTPTREDFASGRMDK